MLGLDGLMVEIEVVEREAEPLPPHTWVWWLQTGNDGWTAPAENNGAPYMPNSHWLVRNIFWFFRNPLGNFVGHGIGLAGRHRTIRGPKPVMLTTWRDARPPRTGWKWCITNGWAPFVSYWGGRVEFYAGWRPDAGGLGVKFAIRKDAYSDQPDYDAQP